jgi:hypothetical protein
MRYTVEMCVVLDAECEEEADRAAEAGARRIEKQFGPTGSEPMADAVVASASVEVVVPKRLSA